MGARDDLLQGLLLPGGFAIGAFVTYILLRLRLKINRSNPIIYHNGDGTMLRTLVSMLAVLAMLGGAGPSLAMAQAP
jgi:hypothetical protein